MGKRIEFNYYIGTDRWNYGFEAAITREASRLAGGCTITFSKGCWVAGADIPQDRYCGDIQRENCLHLQLSVVPLRKLEVNYTMRSCIRQEARKHKVKLDWVHVTTHKVEEHHFQINPGETR